MYTSIRHNLGENIRALRMASGLTKVDFALLLGISRVELDLIESGRSNVKLTTLSKLAVSLDKEPWELIK